MVQAHLVLRYQIFKILAIPIITLFQVLVFAFHSADMIRYLNIGKCGKLCTDNYALRRSNYAVGNFPWCWYSPVSWHTQWSNRCSTVSTANLNCPPQHETLILSPLTIKHIILNRLYVITLLMKFRFRRSKASAVLILLLPTDRILFRLILHKSYIK